MITMKEVLIKIQIGDSHIPVFITGFGANLLEVTVLQIFSDFAEVEIISNNFEENEYEGTYLVPFSLIVIKNKLKL